MKIFTNKNLIQKLVIAIVCLTLFNFCVVPTKVQAVTTVGGALFDLLKDFTTFISDVAISVVQWGLTGEWSFAVDEAGSGEPLTEDGYFVKKDNFKYPIIQVSPELIFANKVEMLDVDFIGGTDNKEYHIQEHSLKATKGSAISTLRTIIASWYVTLRTIAIVGLLSVLIYVGIRIIISSTSQDKAKYKQRLMDWVVAFVLLFFMHYIMAAMVTVVDKVDSLLGRIADVENGIELDSDKGNVTYNPAGLAASKPSVGSSTIVSNISIWFNDNGYKLDNYTPKRDRNTTTGGTIDSWDFEIEGQLYVQLTYDWERMG